MNSQIANRLASPSRGALLGFWRDWVGAAVVLLVWVTLWTMFAVGVLPAASRLAGATEPAGRTLVGAAPASRPAGRAGPAWVAAR
jgi:hypothetical protein